MKRASVTHGGNGPYGPGDSRFDTRACQRIHYQPVGQRHMPRAANLEARQPILEVAHRLFYTSGLSAVSMDAVASAAGMKKANLFHYYPTKESLELAVLDHAAAGMNDRIARVARHSYDPVGAVQRIFDEAGGLMRQS